MKILLDECITKRIKPFLSEFEILTVNDMGWSGVKNGQLMKLCIENKFDILLTIDKNLRFQQNLQNYNIAIVILDTQSSKKEDIIGLLPKFRLKINEFQKHNYYIIE